MIDGGNLMRVGSGGLLHFMLLYSMVCQCARFVVSLLLCACPVEASHESCVRV